MRWISLIPLLLLSACIYTEGIFVTEPEDVIVAPSSCQQTPWNSPCGGTDVTGSQQKSAVAHTQKTG